MNRQPTVSLLNITIEDLRFFEVVFQNFDKIADFIQVDQTDFQNSPKI